MHAPRANLHQNRPHDRHVAASQARVLHGWLSCSHAVSADHLHEIMRCVGYDWCKLWGTLQALGVSTGLRVRMAAEDEPISLGRQEAVALVHTLERFSKSLDYARGFGQA